MIWENPKAKLLLKILFWVSDIAGESIVWNFGDIPYMLLDLFLSSYFVIFSVSDLLMGCKNIESCCFESKNLWLEDFVILETNLFATEV